MTIATAGEALKKNIKKTKKCAKGKDKKLPSQFGEECSSQRPCHPSCTWKKTRLIMIETSGSFDIRSNFPAKNVSEEENNMITFGPI